jgi:hypothetical protein
VSKCQKLDHVFQQFIQMVAHGWHGANTPDAPHVVVPKVVTEPTLANNTTALKINVKSLTVRLYLPQARGQHLVYVQHAVPPMPPCQWLAEPDSGHAMV